MKTCTKCENNATWYSKSAEEFVCDSHKNMFPEISLAQLPPPLSVDDFEAVKEEISHRNNFIENVCVKLDKIKNNIIRAVEESHQKTINSLQYKSLSYSELLLKDNYTFEDLEALQNLLTTKIIYKKPKRHQLKTELHNFYNQELWGEKLLESTKFDNISKAIPEIEHFHGLHLENYGGGANTLTISKNNKYLIIGCKDSSIHVWSLNKKTQKFIMRGESGSIDCLSITSDNSYIISGNSNGLHLWNFRLRKHELLIKSDLKQVRSIVISYDNKYILACGSKESILGASLPVAVYSLDQRKELFDFSSKNFNIACAILCKKNKTLVTGCSDNEVRLWNFIEKRLDVVLEGHKGAITGIALTKDDAYAVSVSVDKTARVWSMARKCMKYLIPISEDGANTPRSLQIAGDDSLLIIGCNEGNVLVWNLKEHREKVIDIDFFPKPVKKALLTLDGNFIIPCGEPLDTISHSNQSVKIWNMSEQSFETSLPGHIDKVTSLTYTSDFEILVSGALDCTVRVWNIEEKTEICVFEGHTSQVNTLCISSNDRYVASGSNDATVKIWDLKKKRLYIDFTGHGQPVIKVKFTNDCIFLVSKCKNKQVFVWNVCEKKREEIIDGSKAIKKWVQEYPEIKEIVEN
ncbi:hypothetical protein SteCoe_25857 [Stentor coeruleus]|uniref:Uncharacterized protein n=1 Tax=Stentor coeruleus TaxID=5963 RepID=A0A1R2BE91_9CILI|nr:hypothetical protein SteCoe_25857 [Stentor coeruleus]